MVWRSLSIKVDNLQPNIPEIITDGVVEVTSYYHGMEPLHVVDDLIEGKYVLIEDYFHNGLEVLQELRKQLKNLQEDNNNYHEEREFRKNYREASNRLLLMITDHEIEVKKAPEIGWFKIFFPDEDQFLISFPQVQGLNSAWQWYINGLEIEAIGIKIHPYYDVYFPTRFDHIELFDEWLADYNGKRDLAIDMGVGSGILSFMLLENDFSTVIGTDINPNAIISTYQDSVRLELDENLKLFHGDLFEKIERKADLIVFNPPWVLTSQEINSGIDQAIYYKKQLFDRFFSQAYNKLCDEGVIVIIFSTFGKMIGDQHPVYRELNDNDRYESIHHSQCSVGPGSQKTRRKNLRKDEKVEIWVLKPMN